MALGTFISGNLQSVNPPSGVDQIAKVSLLQGFANKLWLIWLSTSSLQILTGKCVSDENTSVIELASDLTIAITSAGKNGLSAGSEASNTHYFVWLLLNPTTLEVAAILDVSATSPTLSHASLAGFTKKRLLGSMRNNASSNFVKVAQRGWGNHRFYWFLENSDGILRLLAGGTATSFTDLDCSSLLPPTATVAQIALEATSQQGRLRPNGESMTDWFEVPAGGFGKTTIPVASDGIIEYRTSSGGSVNVEVIGYEEDI